MKKAISIIVFTIICIILILPKTTYAVALDKIDVEVTKTTIRPGEEVTVTIQFGESLGAYTFDIAYDNNIFEYVSAEGGTANDLKSKVRVVFYDSSGGSNPRTNMKVIFKAKEGLTTSNPTQFSITAEGLANADASVNYDDITIPIQKSVTVEPETTQITPPEETTPEEEEPKEESSDDEIQEDSSIAQNTTKEEIPSVLPKTGKNIYFLAIGLIIILIVSLVILSKTK